MDTTSIDMKANEPISCMIIDDEPPAMKILEDYISQLPRLKLIASCHTAIEAVDILSEQPIDLLFLDIQMPKILGTDFLRSLQTPPKVIFTTAYREFAVDGFDLNAVDYLLKPISFDRFLKAVNKLYQINLNQAYQFHQDLPGLESHHLEIRVDRQDVKIKYENILYIEGMKDYVKIVTTDRNYISKIQIQNLEKQLPKSQFIRVHRSFIVSLSKISSRNFQEIHIKDHIIPISRTYRIMLDHAVDQMPVS